MIACNPCCRPLTLTLLAVLVIVGSADGAEPSRWSDEAIAEVLERHCGFRSPDPIRRYRGFLDRFEIQGPLWLHEAGDDTVIGVVLPTFLRLYLFAQARGCKKATVEGARELANNEVWVALWRTEDPPRPGQTHTTHDQVVRRPTRVRWRYEGAWHKPAWTSTRSTWLQSWYVADWNEKYSLLAAFTTLERDGALHVDYEVEAEGQTEYDNPSYSLAILDEDWWNVAFGEVAP